MFKQPQYENETNQVKEHFTNWNVELTDEFDIKICAESICQSISTTSILLCNLEDTQLMSLIAKGEYDEFDIDDAGKFNDNYYEMCEFLNI